MLSQPGSERADGYVTAAEWTGYRLDSDLVVLSACESGRGTAVRGEGLLGLGELLSLACRVVRYLPAPALVESLRHRSERDLYNAAISLFV